MKKAILLLAICALAIPLYAAHPQKPGKWEITTEVELPGMNMKMPPMTHTICITKEDLDKTPENAIPKPAKRGGGERTDCKISDYKLDGNTVTWSIKCEGERPASGSGKITYTSDSYTGTMDMKMGEREIRTKYTGKYLGAECDKQ